MATAKNFGMRLAPSERHEIERLADARDTTMKEAVLEAVRRQLKEIDEKESYEPKGRLKGLDHLVGTFDGPEDLSTNPKYMDGFGQ